MSDAILRDGRSWSVDATGIDSLKRKYIVKVDGDLGHLDTNGELETFQGVPAIGTAHPTYKNLYVSGYSVDEGSGSAKNTIEVTVNYKRSITETHEGGTEEEPTETVCQVMEWGWDSGTEEKELTSDVVTGADVINSAGDPFDRVPTYSGYAPVFTKVMRFEERQSGAMSMNCCVNNAEMTIGDLTAAPGQLLCSVAEKILVDQATFRYQYTVNLKYKSNIVAHIDGSAGSSTEIGWDVAVIDAGMRYRDSDGKMKLITVIDEETGKRCNVTSTELLDGEGMPVDRASTPIVPHVFRFNAYARAKFPDWFTSEPPAPDEDSDS